MNDEIKCYSKNGLDSYYNDLNPDMNIGKMLRVYLEKGYFNGKTDEVDLICMGETNVIALKLKNQFYYFGETQDDINKILNRIPADSFWSQLTEEETITIIPQKISKKAEELKILKSMSATRLLQENLERMEKDIAIFTTENGKIAVFPEYSIQDEVFVTGKIFEFNEIEKIISTPDYAL